MGFLARAVSSKKSMYGRLPLMTRNTVWYRAIFGGPTIFAMVLALLLPHLLRGTVSRVKGHGASVEEVLPGLQLRYISDGGGGCLPEPLDLRQVSDLLATRGAFPQLIEHLDSVKPTECTYDKDPGQPVPLGFVCLDLLLRCVDDGPYRDLVFTGYGDDGLWSNIWEHLYFPPDVLRPPDGSAKMRYVRGAWEALNRATKGQCFRFPPAWYLRNIELEKERSTGRTTSDETLPPPVEPAMPPF